MAPTDEDKAEIHSDPNTKVREMTILNFGQAAPHKLVKPPEDVDTSTSQYDGSGSAKNPTVGIAAFIR